MRDAFDLDVAMTQAAAPVGFIIASAVSIIALPDHLLARPITHWIVGICIVIFFFALLRLTRRYIREGKTNNAIGKIFSMMLLGMLTLWFFTPESSGNSITPVKVSQGIRAAISPRDSVGDKIVQWTVKARTGTGEHVRTAVEQAVREAAHAKPAPQPARPIALALSVESSRGNAVSDQHRLTARVGLRASASAECQFIVHMDRSLRLKAAAEYIARTIVDRTTTFMEGSEAC